MKDASHWEKDGDVIRCTLCSQRCRIASGRTGVCGVRENQDGRLVSLIYGKASSMTPDPIEKKPLFHFHPGTFAFSLGSVGCNFSCLHCQNHTISCANPHDLYMKGVECREVVKLARKSKCSGLAWTYNEPTIWHEFTLDTSRLAKAQGMYNCYVTNGYITEAPLRELAPSLDAMNIDVKAFRDDFYKKIAGARLQPVLDTCILARELGIHIELTYLVIPTKNDDELEIKEFSRWVVDTLGPETPVHFSRFYPHHKMMGIEPTPVSTLQTAYDIARHEGVHYVYLGNIPHVTQENTYCPHCDELLVERVGFSVRTKNISSSSCPSCGRPIHFVL